MPRRWPLLVAAYLLGVVVILTLSGCLQEEPTPTPALPTRTPTPEPQYDVEKALVELAAARSLWESKGSDDYTVNYQAFLYLAYVPTRLTVKDGVIVSAEYLTSLEYGEPLEPRAMMQLRTIDGLFDEIEDALSGHPAWEMSAQYNPDYGYPTDFGVSYSNITDDYFSGGFSMYQPFVPATSPAPSGGE